MTEHDDLDELADLLAEGGEVSAHVAGRARCAEELDELRAATALVQAELALLPDPPLPTGLADRLAAAIRAEAARIAADTDAAGTSSAGTSAATTVTALPQRRGRTFSTRGLSAAAAAVLVLGGAAFGVSQLSQGGGDGDTTAAARDDAGAESATGAIVRNSTGRNYAGRTDLAAAVPALLTGADAGAAAMAPAPAGGTAEDAAKEAGTSTRSQAYQADPLARLRDDSALADCLLALLPPDDPSVSPLALDYGTFNGAPALVVLLPSALPRKLDVFVVGAGCRRGDENLLFYTSVDAP